MHTPITTLSMKTMAFMHAGSILALADLIANLKPCAGALPNARSIRSALG